MDVGGHVIRTLREARARLAAGEIDVEAMRACASRASRLVERAAYLRARGQAPATRDALALATLRRLAEAVARGGTVVSLDVGASEGRAIEDVGITTWRDGAWETVTLVDEAALHRHPDAGLRVMRHPSQAYRAPIHGEVRAIPLPDVLAGAAAAYRAGDVVAFHAARADLPRLGLDEDVGRVLDTYACSRLWRREGLSLVALCRGYGIGTAGAHNSGDDSRMTLEAALAMAGDPRLPAIAERNRLRIVRDEARGRAVLHPTRGPDHARLLAEWEAANAAARGYRTGPLGGPASAMATSAD